MSLFIDVMNAHAADIVTAVPGATTLIGEIPEDKIGTGDFPHFQLQSQVDTPIEEFVFRHSRNAIVFTVLALYKDTTFDAMWDALEAIVTQVNLDPEMGLGGAIHWSEIGSKNVDPKVYTGAKLMTFGYEFTAEYFD